MNYALLYGTIPFTTGNLTGCKIILPFKTAVNCVTAYKSFIVIIGKCIMYFGLYIKNEFTIAMVVFR